MVELRDHLTRVGQAVTQAGLVVGSGGNLSARPPGSDEFWVTGAGTWLDQLDRDAYVQVGLDGSQSGPGTPSTELALHVATYRVRPDANAIVHLHPQVAILLDAMGERIRLISTDHAYYLGKIARTPFHPPGTQELAQAAAEAVADGTNCVILGHHGCSVLGDSIEMAHRRAANLEEAARLTYRALLLGRDIEECPPFAGSYAQ